MLLSPNYKWEYCGAERCRGLTNQSQVPQLRIDEPGRWAEFSDPLTLQSHVVLGSGPWGSSPPAVIGALAALELSGLSM